LQKQIQQRYEGRMKLRKSVILALFGIAIVVIAIFLNFPVDTPQNVIVVKKKTKPTIPIKLIPDDTASSKSASKNIQNSPPSFDTVLTTNDGNAVIAGRAIPGSKVEIFDQGKKIGEATSNKRGEWLFQPKNPLEPGNRTLSLSMISPDGSSIKSASDVIIVIPEKGRNIAGLETKTPTKPLAIKVPSKPNDKLEVLQKPNADIATPIVIDSIDYDKMGKLDIVGKAPVNSIVNLYLNNNFLGRGKSNEFGIWRYLPENAVAPGKYTLRADHVDENGNVKSRIQVIFARSTPLDSIKPGSLIVVESGRSLWRIARKTYGKGLRYTVIYEANKDQIKDPDLIFPGQVFSLPAIE